MQHIQPRVHQGRVVLLREPAIYHVERGYLAQFQVFYQRDAVEDPAFQVIGAEERDVLVHHELHRLHEAERLRRQEEALVAVGDVKFRIRHLAPDDARLHCRVNVAEGRKPKAFLGVNVGAIVEELVVHVAHRMRQADDGGILTQIERRLLPETVVIERLTWSET